MSTRMSGYRILLLGIAFLIPVFGVVIAQDQKDRDPHVMEDGRGLEDDPDSYRRPRSVGPSTPVEHRSPSRISGPMRSSKSISTEARLRSRPRAAPVNRRISAWLLMWGCL